MEEGLPPKKPSLALEESDYSWNEDTLPAAKKDKLTVAVVCVDKSGHMLPVLYICGELAKRGHRVRVHVPGYGQNEFEKKVKQVGAEFVPLDMQGYTSESIESSAKASGKIIFLLLEEVMIPALRSEFTRCKPDAVLVDFASIAGCQVAEEMGIPLVLNVPGPLSLVRAFCGMVDTSTAFNFLGIHIGRQRLNTLSLVRFLGVRQMSKWGDKLRGYIARGAMVLVQTIWGLDKTMPIYPNIIVTGPVLPPAADLRDKLAKNHPDLCKFLRASPDGVVYVTTGSLAKLHDWQVRVMFKGLKKAKYRVVWSLKEELQAFLPVKDDPDFFVSKWTPQAELLQDPSVKVVITHCGWGGTLETLTAAKPIIAIPFFGDQPENAQLLKEYGAAELIGKIPTGAEKEPNPYKEGWITEESVSSAVIKLMSNPSYAKAAAKLMNASRASGGVEAAGEHVKWAARYGTSHLKPENFLYSTGSNPYSGVVVGLISLCACAGAFAFFKATSK